MSEQTTWKPAWRNLQLLNPLITLSGSTDATKGLPQLAENPRTNLMLWNSIGTTAAGLLLGSAIKGLSGMTQNEWWQTKKKKAEEAKLNALQPVTQPDTNMDDTEEREKRRAAELQKSGSAEDTMPDGSVPEGQNFFQRYMTETLKSATPLALGGLGLWIGTQATNRALQESRENALDREIADKRNQLDALHRQIMEQRLQQHRAKTAVPKQASISDVVEAMRSPVSSLYHTVSTAYGDTKKAISDAGNWVFGKSRPADKHDSSRGAVSTLAELPTLSAGALALLGAYTTYQFAKRRDEERAKLKQMRSLAATNLTNIAPRLQLELDDNDTLKLQN